MSNLGEFKAPPDVKRWRSTALGIGGIGLIVWLVGLYFSPEQALRSWLLGFIFWAGIGFGCLGVLMLQYLTGGAWGVVIRRVTRGRIEHGADTSDTVSAARDRRQQPVMNGRIYRRPST